MKEEERDRVVRSVLANHPDGSICQIVGQVVAARVGVDLDDRVALDELVGMVQIRAGAEYSVELVEATLQWPGAPRRSGGCVGLLGEMPFAHHERAIPGRLEDLGQRDDVLSEPPR